MSITINISPELEERLRLRAMVAGLAVDRYIEHLLQMQIHGGEGIAKALDKEETDLLEKINLGISQEEWERYFELIHKRDAEVLTSSEQEELIRISDKIEEANADRIRFLIELAELRQVSLEEVMEELGIKGPSHG